MLKFAICDDEIAICDRLLMILEGYFEEKDVDVLVDLYYSADDLMNSIKNDKKIYDVIFLDIEMDGTSGIEFGKEFRNDLHNEITKIIFVSWESAYAMELFKIRPIDFIIKPLIREKIEDVLDVVINLVDQSKRYLVYSNNGKNGFVHYDEIMYIMSSNRVISIVTSEERIRFTGKLDDVVKRLDDKYFWRIHKSFVINPLYAKKIQYDNVLMRSGEKISISQKYRVGIRQKQKVLMSLEKK